MLGVIYLLAPSTVGTSWGFHDRFPPAIAAVLAAGLRLTRDNASGSPVPAHGLTFPRCLAAVVVIAVMARLVTVLVAWQGYDVRYAEYREAMRAIEPGSRLSAAIAVTGSADVLRRPSLYHLGNLATLERDAFFPTIFTYQAQQPLRLSRDFARQPRPRVLYRNTASDAMSDDPASPFSAEMLAHYDYVLVINESLFGPLPTTLEPVRSGNDFTLFRSPRTGQEDGS